LCDTTESCSPPETAWPPPVGAVVDCSVFSVLPEHGNRTTVTRLAVWPQTPQLQARARMAPVHESTFVVARDQDIEIRWFSRACEVPLCGHGALAVAALWQGTYRDGGFTEVSNLRGRLWLGTDEGRPAIALKTVPLIERPPTTVNIGITPTRVFDAGRDFLVVLETEKQLMTYQPDWAALHALPKIGCILSSPSATATAAFRFFAPRAGLPEDRASGSAAPALVELWGKHPHERCTFRQYSGYDITIHARFMRGRIVIAGDVLELSRVHPPDDTHTG
jgi:predicted PhzF superfamily epimerase YddE/YHI9